MWRSHFVAPRGRDGQPEGPRRQALGVDPEGARRRARLLLRSSLVGERELLPRPELDAHDLLGSGHDVVVLIEIHADREVAARQIIEVQAVGVEARVQVVVEVVGDGDLASRPQLVEHDLAVAVEPHDRIADPVRVGRPVVVADFPIELIVLELV
jgi:hypothetical protein